MIMSSKTIARFLGSLVIVSWLFQLAALHFAGGLASEAITPWLVATMFIPSLWSIIYLTIFNRGGWKSVQFRPGNPLFLLAAALIPAIIACGVIALMIANGWATSVYFDFGTEGVKILDGPWVLGNNRQGWAYWAANIAATAIYFAIINSVFAVGEEFGWRGVMQTHLIERLGFYKGVTLLGFVWAIWHLPMNLAGYNHPDTPVLGALVLFPIEHIALSFIMGCLTLWARSFWPAVLFHGSINGIAQGLMTSLATVDGVSSTMAECFQIGLAVAVALICLAVTPAHIRKGQKP